MGDVTPFTRCQCGKGGKQWIAPDVSPDVYTLCEACLASVQRFYTRFKPVALAMTVAGLTEDEITAIMRDLMERHLPKGLAESISQPGALL